MIGFQMDEKQQKLVSEVRDLMVKEVSPLAVEMDARGDDTFDWRLVDVLARHNLLAPTVPDEYGGRGMDFLSLAMVVEEVAAASAGLAACMTGIMHAITPIVLGGTEKQKQNFLPPLTLPQPVLVSFAVTEPKGGSDLESLETRAKKHESDYILTGTKDHVINGAVARYFTVCATTSSLSGRAGLRFFIIPKESVSSTKTRNKIGIHYANTAQIIFDQVHVPPENVLGNEGTGYPLLTQTLDYGRALVGAIEVGIARAAYQIALEYSRERYQFGRQIFSNQGISFPLAEMATQIDAARFMVWRACCLMDQEDDYTKESSMAKLYASVVAQKVTAQTIDILGAMGYDNEGLPGIYFRDAKVGSIVDGTSNIQKMTIASLL